jgi:hypothetical protein
MYNAPSTTDLTVTGNMLLVSVVVVNVVRNVMRNVVAL